MSETSIGSTLTGTPAQIIERLEQMEAAGIDNIAIACTNSAGARDLVADFGSEVIAKFLKRTHSFKVEAIDRLNGTTVEITLKPEGEVLKFRAGQFAFVSFPEDKTLSESYPSQ